MEIVTTLPKGQPTIGWKRVQKGVEKKIIRKIVIARNCPESIKEKLSKTGLSVQVFDGDQQQLGTRLGKPFFIAVVGFGD